MRNPPIITPEYAEKIKNQHELVFENPIKKIFPGVFKGNRNIVNVRFLEYVDLIGPEAFLGCSNLKNLYHKTILTIARQGFCDCALSNIDTSKIKRFGNSSFAFNNIEQVAINHPCTLAERVFVGNKLRTIDISVPLEDLSNTKYDDINFLIILGNSVFLENHNIETVFFSAPIFSLNAFAKCSINNLFLDFNIIKNILAYDFFKKPEIDNIFCNKIPEKYDPSSYFEMFESDFKSQIKHFTIEDLLSTGISLDKVNRFLSDKIIEPKFEPSVHISEDEPDEFKVR